MIKRFSIIFTLFTLLFVTGCGSTKGQNEEQANVSLESTPAPTEQNNASYPRVISVNGKDITIPKKPERIAAISLDAADVALELVDPERMVVVPKSSSDSSLAYRTEEAGKVPNKIMGATSLDPEQVLSYNADLLIMTKLHNKEKEVNDILQQSGIPILTLESWKTIEDVMNNITIIGQAVGEDAKAEKIVTEMKIKLEKISKAVEGVNKPSVLVVSPLGPGTGPYLMGSSNISYDIVRLAGAVNAADQIGLTKTTKASIEQIIKADPEYILLIEWQEGKVGDLEEIMQTPGWSTLQAVQNNKVKQMPAKKLLNPNRYNVDHLEEIAKWLHPERFESQ
jgi:iron complex transport system substrate-binding protein